VYNKGQSYAIWENESTTMAAKLRVLIDTVFKRSVQQSGVLSAEAKVSVQQGQELNVARYCLAEQFHLQLTFDHAPFATHPDTVQWFVFSGHVELIELEQTRSLAPPEFPDSDGGNT
jgi:hypothetical protein